MLVVLHVAPCKAKEEQTKSRNVFISPVLWANHSVGATIVRVYLHQNRKPLFWKFSEVFSCLCDAVPSDPELRICLIIQLKTLSFSSGAGSLSHNVSLTR